MSKYLLKITCPACRSRRISQRYHECGGKRYIDEDLYLYCDKCNNKTFFFDAKFQCENHDFREVNLTTFLESIACLSNSSEIPSSIIKKMMMKGLDYERTQS